MTEGTAHRRVLLHPLLVPVPIGCWVASFGLDLASLALPILVFSPS